MNPQLLYHTGFWTFGWSMTLGWSYRAFRRENLPATGPCLIVSNHVSHLDPPLVGLAAIRPLTYLARHTLFKPGFPNWLITSLGAMPIDRDMGKGGLQSVLNALALGKAVLLFPEGTRSEDGTLQDLKPGISLILKKADCPIIPCGIAGAFEAWPKSQKLPRPSPLFLPDSGRSIAVSFGEPIPAGHYRKTDRDTILGDLKRRIAECALHAETHRRKRVRRRTLVPLPLS